MLPFPASANRRLADRSEKPGNKALYSRPQSGQGDRDIRHTTLQARNQVETMFGRLKTGHRIATRHDRCPKILRSTVALTATILFQL
ncbi:MAG: transposase [Rhodobacteraceae bacterium]|nr:transposase [Paracoccaceae bacterium]